MSLDFAIEAAKRGCPYVDNAFTYMRFKPSDPNSMGGTFYSIENATPYTRFIIGATLALWWSDWGAKNGDDLNQGNLEIAKQLSLAAREFAKGFKR